MNEVTTVERRARVAELWLRGWTQGAIASELGCSQSTVSSDLRDARRVWQETVNEKLDALKADELARLGVIERAAWGEFARTGNSAFLRVLLRSSEQRSRILGLVKDIHLNFNHTSFDWDAIANGYPDPLESKLLELSDGRAAEEESLPTAHGEDSTGDPGGGGRTPTPICNGTGKSAHP